MYISSPDVVVDNPVTVAGGVISVDSLPAIGGNVSVSNFPGTFPVSGAVSVSNFPATQPVSGTVSVGNVVSVITAVASSATLTSVSQPNTTDTMLLASNANRKSAIIFIPKSGVYVKYGAGASASSFTIKTAAANSTLTITGYTGQINSFGPSDTINVTELV